MHRGSVTRRHNSMFVEDPELVAGRCRIGQQDRVGPSLIASGEAPSPGDDGAHQRILLLWAADYGDLRRRRRFAVEVSINEDLQGHWSAPHFDRI